MPPSAASLDPDLSGQHDAASDREERARDVGGELRAVDPRTEAASPLLVRADGAQLEAGTAPPEQPLGHDRHRDDDDERDRDRSRGRRDEVEERSVDEPAGDRPQQERDAPEDEERRERGEDGRELDDPHESAVDEPDDDPEPDRDDERGHEAGG